MLSVIIKDRRDAVAAVALFKVEKELFSVIGFINGTKAAVGQCLFFRQLFKIFR